MKRALKRLMGTAEPLAIVRKVNSNAEGPATLCEKHRSVGPPLGRETDSQECVEHSEKTANATWHGSIPSK
mgnify:CR=1 FL=1